MDIYERALVLHDKCKGKLEVVSKVSLTSKEDLSLAYTPGVARACTEIARDESLAYEYTWKGNSVAVVSDGSAVLGLGDIGPSGAMPVMEGKAILFKEFGDINAVPLCLDTKDTEEIISIVKAIAPTFGGINLEDISAPRCVEIERRLKAELDIPVFHDDQHGTAIVVVAGIINALKIVDKKIEDLKVVVSGAGAAGSSIIHMLVKLGVKDVIAFNKDGIILEEDMEQYDFLTKELCVITNKSNVRETMKESLVGSDIFIGVSAPKVLTQEMIKGMAKDPIVFAMANPEPEIHYHEAIEAGVCVMGTGRSDYPNQINNVLAFPGLFKGALSVRAKCINEDMKLAASYAIASLVGDDLACDYVVPSILDSRVKDVVSKAVAKAAIDSGVV